MSFYDYTNKSDYDHNKHSYVTKIETYVEEVRDPRVVEYRYPSSSMKVEPKAIHNYDHPPEVAELITKILTEVNGPPTSNTAPDTRAYWGQRIPVRVGSKSDYTTDPVYGSSPSERNYGDPNHVYDQQQQRDYDYPNNQWGRSSHPVYNQLPRRESYGLGYQPPREGPYGSNNQWEVSATKPETLKTFGVPDTYWGRSDKSSNPSYGDFRNQGPPKNQWRDSPTNLYTQQDCGSPSNPSYFKPEVSRDEIRKEYRVPINQWDGSPMKSDTRHYYIIPDNPETLRGQQALYNKSDDSLAKPHHVGDFRVPNKQWESFPTKSQNHKDRGPPYNHWDSPPNNSHALGDYGIPNNKQNISSNPNFYHNFETSKNYAVPENSPMNSPKLKGYQDPNHYWDRLSSPVYHPPPTNTQFFSKPKPQNEQENSPTKVQTRQDNGTLSNSWDKSSSPSYESQPSSMTCKDGVCTLNDKPKFTHGPYEDQKGKNSHNYPRDTIVGDDGRRSNPYIHEHQPEKDPNVNDNTRTSTPLGKVTNNIGEALGQLAITAGSSPESAIGRSTNPTTLAGPRVGLPGLGHTRPRLENPRDSTHTYIDSREAAKRYGGETVPLRPY